MAVQGERLLKTYKAAAAMGTNHVIVYQSAANSVSRATGSAVVMVGVCENNAAINEPVPVCFSGMSKVHTGTSAISRGDWLTADSRGYAIATATSLTNVIGRAETASTQDGNIIEVNVIPGFLH